MSTLKSGTSRQFQQKSGRSNRGYLIPPEVGLFHQSQAWVDPRSQKHCSELKHLARRVLARLKIQALVKRRGGLGNQMSVEEELC